MKYHVVCYEMCGEQRKRVWRNDFSSAIQAEEYCEDMRTRGADIVELYKNTSIIAKWLCPFFEELRKARYIRYSA